MATRTKKADPAVESNGHAKEPIPAGAKQQPPKTIIVRDPGRKIIAVPIVGVTPLVVHNLGKKMALEFLATRFGADKVPKGVKDPEAEFNESRYISPEGWDGMHAGAFRSAMVEAARLSGGVKMTEAKRLFSIIADGHSVPLEISELGLSFSPKPLIRIIGNPKMRTDMIRVDNNAPDVRFRAEYWPWRAILRIDYLASALNEEGIVRLVALAGMTDGVGEGRPSAKQCVSSDNGRWEIDKTKRR